MASNNATEWSPSAPLEWSHFEADPHPGEYRDALAVIRYDCNWTVESHKSGKSLFFTISGIKLTTTLLRNLSWVRKRMADDALLAYARGCFDLAEHLRPDMEAMLAAEFGRKRYPVRGSNEEQRMQYSRQDSRVVLSGLNEIHRSLDSEIAAYGAETDFGRNAEAQEYYDGIFGKMRSARSA